jgi:hypothetical protein
MTALLGMSIYYYCIYRRKMASTRLRRQIESTFHQQTQQQTAYSVNPNTPIDNQLSIREAPPPTYQQI